MLLGRYRLGDEIGRGGMSTVYRGEDTKLGRAVAIKVLAPHLSGDVVFRRRLLAEAQAAARLPHPHIVQVFDAGVVEDDAGAPAGGSVVLVLELVEGQSLRERLGTGTIPVAEAAEIAAQVAEALAYAHERGIVHRDVKPHNVLLASAPGGERGRVWAKLADFGIARSVDATSTLTATGVLLGSAPYVAPELLEGGGASPESDIYALGVSLYQMLTGHLPFDGGTTAVGLARRLAADAPRVSALRPEVPAWLDALVARALARRPEERWADAGQLARALRDPHGATTQALPALGLRPVTAPEETRVVAAPQGRRSGRPGSGLSRALVGAAAAVLVVAVAVIAVNAAAPRGTSAVPGAGPRAAVPAAPSATTEPAATATPVGPPTPTPVVIRLR
ncbi:MAG TPA: serine/threonine-protein kinase [Chloroflexota bacterium]|nr:serine/threonine-protein kinase [Chloroflexota bacterium]